MSPPRGNTIKYDIKGEPRKFWNGSQQLQDFVHNLRQEAVLLAKKVGANAVAADGPLLRQNGEELDQQMG